MPGLRLLVSTSGLSAVKRQRWSAHRGGPQNSKTQHRSGVYKPVMATPTPSLFPLGEQPLSLEALQAVAEQAAQVVLTPTARRRIQAARAVVEAIANGGDESPSVYGVNTGFGFLADVRI